MWACIWQSQGKTFSKFMFYCAINFLWCYRKKSHTLEACMHTCFFCCISFNVNYIYSRQRLYCFYRMIVNIANKYHGGKKQIKDLFVHTHHSTAQMHISNTHNCCSFKFIYGAVNHSTNEETNKSSNFTLKILFVCSKLILCRQRPR